jgi:enterobactin synthetase component D / holo-[acyl-carrier protein] synthase
MWLTTPCARRHGKIALPGDIASLANEVDVPMSLATILPEEVTVVEAEDWMWRAPLLPDEAEAVRHAGSRRRREFAAGRTCARIALQKIGIHQFSIRCGADRLPRWPHGIVGSITHSTDYCAAAIGIQPRILGLGIDAEENAPLTIEEADLICSALELERAARVSLPASVPVPRLIFSAKESFFKCYYALVRQFLEFSDVTVSIIDDNRFVAELGTDAAPSLLGHRRCEGRFAVDQYHILTAVALR